MAKDQISSLCGRQGFFSGVGRVEVEEGEGLFGNSLNLLSMFIYSSGIHKSKNRKM